MTGPPASRPSRPRPAPGARARAPERSRSPRARQRPAARSPALLSHQARASASSSPSGSSSAIASFASSTLSSTGVLLGEGAHELELDAGMQLSGPLAERDGGGHRLAECGLRSGEVAAVQARDT